MDNFDKKILDFLQRNAKLTAKEITAFKKGIKALLADAWGKTLAEITEKPF